MKTLRGTIGLMGACLLTGCGVASGDADEHLGEVPQAVQSDVVSFTESGTGLWINLLTTNSSPVYAAIKNGGYTCGSTFISKHHAITAAHCTSGVAIGGNISLVKIMTTNLNTQEVTDAAVVSGTSNPGNNPPSTIGAPSYTINDQLVSGDGYIATNMTCTVKYRCADASHGWGTRSCPGSEDMDMALINCSGRPTPLDWISVHAQDPNSGDMSVVWFHELYNLAMRQTDTNNNVPADNWWNYGYYNGNMSINYHYIGSVGAELLPLQTWHYPGTPETAPKTKIVTAQCTTQYCGTDAPLCHGTSGGAAIYAGTSSLLGPMVTGGLGSPDLTNRLCHDFENTVPGSWYGNFVRAVKSRILEGTSDVQNDR